MCLYYSVPNTVSILSEVSGHFSVSISSEKKVEMQQCLIQLLAADGGAYLSPAFSEKHTIGHCSQLVWVADAEVITFGGIIAGNAALVYIGEKG